MAEGKKEMTSPPPKEYSRVEEANTLLSKTECVLIDVYNSIWAQKRKPMILTGKKKGGG